MGTPQRNLREVIRLDPVHLSDTEWKRLWDRITSPDMSDVDTETYCVQFRAQIQAPTPDTYLCIHQDKTVHIDGKRGNQSTYFKIIHCSIPNTPPRYQIISWRGPWPNYILYVENGQLKSRPFDKKKDVLLSSTQEEPSPTVFTITWRSHSSCYIETEGEKWSFSCNRNDSTDAAEVILKQAEPDSNITFDFQPLMIKPN